MNPQISLPQEALKEFCRKWHVQTLSLFGSALRDDFGPESDIDLIVEFAPGTEISLFDLAQMEAELETIFDRNVDLLTRASVETSRNYIRRNAILESVEPLYVA